MLLLVAQNSVNSPAFIRSTLCQAPCHTLGITGYHKAQPLSSRTLRPGCQLALFPEYYFCAYL